MKKLSRDFVSASQQLADAMLVDVQARDPTLTQQISEAIARGEVLVISCVFGPAPDIELVSRSDYGTTRRIGSIAMQIPVSH